MKTVIEIAREAGMVYREFEDEFANANTDGVDVETLERFAELVRADEREACAQLATTIAEQDLPEEMPEGEELLQAVRQIAIGVLIAKAIRKGNT